MIQIHETDLLSLCFEHGDTHRLPGYLARQLVGHPAIHIHFGDDPPSVWKINSWNSAIRKYELDKELSRLNNRVSLLKTEIRNKILRKLSAMSGLPGETFEQQVNALLHARTETAIQHFGGVSMAELIKADAELAEFIRTNKIPLWKAGLL